MRVTPRPCNDTLAMPETRDRDLALVIADEPLRSQLVDAARHRGYEPHAARTPLDAIQALVRDGDKIRYAILSSAPSWTLPLRELIAEEYPGIHRLMLVA